MSSTDELIRQYEGKIVPYSFNAGYVCLSYAVSLVGSASTLELMRRRTSHRGYHNLLLLAGAAMCMGGIAIWSMHFIGNRALFILDGRGDLQIGYSTGLTVASMFVPILVLLLAFLALTNNDDRVQWWKVSVAGFLAGGAICGMHYLGNASISNYHCSYNAAYVVGAAIIAVSASTAALAVFFVFESSWKSAWWRRVLCAAVLAGAVSGMHWCAAVGTQYVLRGFARSETGGMSRETTIIIVICLAIAAFVVTGASLIYSYLVKRSYANRAQQVVLAAAVFDKRGRILVNKQGLLPTEVVTDSLLLQTNEDIFDTNHSLFHWAYRASRNWASIANLIDGMAAHLSQLTRQRNSNSVKLMQDDGSPIPEYDIVCHQLFSLAASSLASKLRLGLQDVGVLWDEIFATGRTRYDADDAYRNYEQQQLQQAQQAGIRTSNPMELESMAEKAHISRPDYGRGSLMMLVQHVRTRSMAEQLESVGYRFAELDQVVGIMRSSMQIKTPDLGSRLRQMATGSSADGGGVGGAGLEPGVHVGVFAIRARVDHTGFDVLVQRPARHLLPSGPLHMETLEQRHIGYLNHLQNQSMAVVADRLSLSTSQNEMGKFAAALLDGIRELRDQVQDDGLFDGATMMQQPIRIPCYGQRHGRESPLPSSTDSISSDAESDSDTAKASAMAPPSSAGAAVSKSHATIIVFQLVLPIHRVANIPRCVFIPLRFFKVKQLALENSPHHLDFSHAVHRDMSTVLESHGRSRFRDALESFKQRTSRMLPTRKRTRTKRAGSPTKVSHRRGAGGGDEEDGRGHRLEPHKPSVAKRGRNKQRAVVTTKERSDSQVRLSPTSRAYGEPSPSALTDSFSDWGDSSGSSMRETPLSPVTATEMEMLSPVSAVGPGPGIAQTTTTSSPLPPLPSTTTSPPPTKQMFGGIMVSQEIVVETAELSGDGPAPPFVQSAAVGGESGSGAGGSERRARNDNVVSVVPVGVTSPGPNEVVFPSELDSVGVAAPSAAAAAAAGAATGGETDGSRSHHYPKSSSSSMPFSAGGHSNGGGNSEYGHNGGAKAQRGGGYAQAQPRHAAGAFRAEQETDKQGGMYVDQLLSLCMRKQVVI